MNTKKAYIVPETKILTYRTDSLLYKASVSYGGENNDQPDEAKQGLFEEEDNGSLEYSLSGSSSLWAEDDEEL